MCKDDAIQHGLVPMGDEKKSKWAEGRKEDLMIIVSSISSTPERNLFAKTGGTERTIDALTERNSSFSFSLRALLGEPSTSMGTGEFFRFIFDGHWTGPQGKIQLCANRAEVVTNLAGPAHAVLTVALGTRIALTHRVPSLSTTLRVTRARHNMVITVSRTFWRNYI